MAQAPDIIGKGSSKSEYGILQEATNTIRWVLDYYLSDLELDPNSVAKRVRALSTAYEELYRKNVVIDFGNEGTRIAYMYLYFLQHCFFFYRVLCDLHERQYIKEFESTEELKVCCIGGGPGTDLVALILFLQEKRMLPKSMHCTIVDKQTEWKDTWDKIWKDFPKKPEPENFQIEVLYESCDLLETEDLPEGVLNAVSEAHIITMITTYSHVYRSYQQKIKQSPIKLPRLDMMLKKMMEESLMLFIDQENNSDFETLFWENHAEPAHLSRLEKPIIHK